MEWVRTWLFTTWRTDHLAKVEQVIWTAADLRHAITEARNDPAVRRWQHNSRRELIGDKPTQCRNGHPLTTVGTMANPHDWLPCPCGGHWWILCRACSDETVDPPPAYDCQPHRPARH